MLFRKRLLRVTLRIKWLLLAWAVQISTIADPTRLAFAPWKSKEFTMKRFILALAAVAALSFGSFAESAQAEHRSHGHRGHHGHHHGHHHHHHHGHHHHGHYHGGYSS